jgi:hypothetical protein
VYCYLDAKAIDNKALAVEGKILKESIDIEAFSDESFPYHEIDNE